MKYSLDKITLMVEGRLINVREGYVSNVITDSRRVYQTRDVLFIALRGPNHDGHKYIPELIDKGIQYFIVDNTFSPPAGSDTLVFIFVDDTLKALQRLAACHRSGFTGKVLAITGSNGKTVVKEWLAQLLSKYLSVSKSPKSYNSQIGVPVSVLQMDSGPDYHILEAGISMPGEMDRLEKMIQPEEGIITNIGDAHQENFKDQTEKLGEKLILFKNSKILYYCADNKLISKELNRLFGKSNKKLVSWAVNNEADLKVEFRKGTGGGTSLSGIYRNKNHRLEIPFSDWASIENIIHIWLFWLNNDFPADLLQDNVNELEAVAMRLEQKEGINDCTLINDFYNADLHSLSIALDLLFNQLPQNKKSLILSDLLQTGLDDKELIRRINTLLADKDLFRFIGIGKLFVQNKSSFVIPVDVYPDTENFLNEFAFSDLNNEAILLKGARKFTFEKISRRLEKRQHNTFVEVKMNNLLANLNHFRTKTNANTKIMAMVKAFSYGSGSHEIAKFLAHQRIDYLGVAFSDEGAALRLAGVTTPIMVMNPGLHNPEHLFEHLLEPEIFSLKALDVFIEAANKGGLKNYPVHIKLDTGMHRLGFQEHEVDELIETLRRQSFLQIKSVFSHLTSADNSAKDEYTHQQANRFRVLSEKIKSKVEESFLTHLVNTSGIQRFPEYHFDMVRLGIGLYGIDPSGLAELWPVISLKSHISQIHYLKKGDTVGYGNSGKIVADTRIAVIPVGYADGLDRRLGNGYGEISVNDQSAPFVGQICMDMCMVDLKSIEAREGDEVTLIGKELSLNNIAVKLETIPYEILTRIPQRVKRIYFFE